MAEGERYLDLYSIQHAINDRVILPVTYEARLSNYFIDEDKIDAQFEELTVELSDEEKQHLIQRYEGKKDVILKMPARIDAITQDIIEHFKTHVEPNGFKAQIVVSGRQMAVLYKKALDRFLKNEEISAIVYSSGDPNKETDELKAYNTTKEERDSIIDNFKNKEHLLKFLIVSDMLLTGFDAPIEQTMYVDKNLSGHNLLQAIARTNRVGEANKFTGHIVDYYGITTNLKKALHFDESKEVEGTLISIEEYKTMFKEQYKLVSKILEQFDWKDGSDENLKTMLQYFELHENEKQNFKCSFEELEKLYEITSPDPFLREYLTEFKFFSKFYIAFMKHVYAHDKKLHLAGYGAKMQKLIKENIDFERLSKTFKQINIADIDLLNRLEQLSPEEQFKKLDMLLTAHISQHPHKTNNLLYLSFAEKLTQIKDDIEHKQEDLQQLLNKLYRLLHEVKNADEVAQEQGFNDTRDYGLYLILHHYAQDGDEEIMKELIENFITYLDDQLDAGRQHTIKKEDFVKRIKIHVQDDDVERI